MQEVRLRWSKGIQKDPASSPFEHTPGAGLWFPDTPDNRLDLETIRDCGNDSFGEGTHWIEERQA